MLIPLVRQRGLEPLTYGLEGRCSIRLSYWRNYSISLRTNFTKNFFNQRNSRIFYDLLVDFILSGRQDSNLRPPAPKAGAITGLRYAPKMTSQERTKKYTYYSSTISTFFSKNWSTNIYFANLKTKVIIWNI